MFPLQNKINTTVENIMKKAKDNNVKGVWLGGVEGESTKTSVKPDWKWTPSK